MRSHDLFIGYLIAVRVRVGVLRINPLHLIKSRWIARVRSPFHMMADISILVSAKRRMRSIGICIGL